MRWKMSLLASSSPDQPAQTMFLPPSAAGSDALESSAVLSAASSFAVSAAVSAGVVSVAVSFGVVAQAARLRHSTTARSNARSFFMVSFVITSCLDDDNNIEYSPDATIHAFALDTAGLGSYKFTIDQLSCEIYNEDSLPVHADTIIDKILIKTLTTSSGVVTMKDKSGNDSV